MSQLHHGFFDEALKNLGALEEGLLRFDPRESISEQLNAIFRSAHSVKGGAAAFGFTQVAAFVHLMESVLEGMRSSRLQADAAVIDLLLESVDTARSMLLCDGEGGGATKATPHDLIQRLRARVPDLLPSPAARLLAIRIGPVEQLADVQAVMALFRDIPGLGITTRLHDEGGNVHAFQVRTDSSNEELMTLFAFHVAKERVSIQNVESMPTPGLAGANVKMTTIDTDTDTDTDRGVLATPVGRAPMHVQTESATVRVASAKVEHLVELTVQIAGIQTMLERGSHALDPVFHAQLLAGLDELRRSTSDLQECAQEICMMPVAAALSRFPRMLRDLSRMLGKKFAMVSVGDETEIDVAILEKITDPLMHLVRNSCDHGIEALAERRSAGKPDEGTITVSVTRQQGSVTIEVRDDGRGLAREKILNAARHRGLIVSDQIADYELWQLVFAAGFSTAEAVTELSGRGVGLDVVKRNVTALGGEVTISSPKGQGTCISMRLPIRGASEELHRLEKLLR